MLYFSVSRVVTVLFNAVIWAALAVVWGRPAIWAWSEVMLESILST